MPHMTKRAEPAKWYSIRIRGAIAAAALAAAGGSINAASSAEVFIYGDIGESWWDETTTAAQFVRDINALKVDSLTVRINSVGGSAMDGIAIYNALKRHPADVSVVIDGLAASIASLIAMAGDSVEIASNAMLMIHGGSTSVYGNATEHRNAAAMLDQWNAAMATSYAAKTGDEQASMLALLTDGQDHWYTAAEALELKFVDAITDPLPITASAVAAPLNLQRYSKSLPAALAHGLASSPANPPANSPASSLANSLPVAAVTPPKKDVPMDPKDTPVVAAAAAEVQAAIDRGIAQESARRVDIRAAFEPFMNNADVQAYLAKAEADVKVTLADAKTELLKIMAKGAGPVGNPRIEHVEDERDKVVAAHVEAIMARAGLSNEKGRIRASDANPYRGMKLLDMARASLQRAGIKTDGMDQMRLVGAAFSPVQAGIYQGTTDFPVLLENTLHKVVQAAYALAPDTWSKWAKRGSVTDFRAHPRYRVGSLSNLEAVNELGEFKNKAIPDGEKSSITAGTKGNLISISRQAVVNDDLQVFTDFGSALGRAAKRTVEADAYALLVSNPTLGDGIALFHASHGNLPTAAAPSVVSVDAMRVAMAIQKDVGGNDYLDLRPSIVLAPMSLGGTLRVINASEYDPDTANKLQRKNQVMNLFSDVVDSPRLSGTGWYTFADPMAAPVIEVAFLDGNDTPFLDLHNGFTVDGATYKVRLDFGIAAIDYRGAVFNAGA